MASPSFFQMRTALYDDDPYPIYRFFRANDPVHKARDQRIWYLFRHADVAELLRDERLTSEQIFPDLSRVPENLLPMMEMRPRWMLTRDGPEHTRLRTPVARTFTPQRVAALVPRFESLADSLLESCLSLGQFDAIEDYALPFVRIGMAELSGIPEGQRPDFSRCVADMETVTNTREAIERMAAATQELGNLFHDLLAMRRARPTSDLISAIAALEGENFSSDDQIATCVLLISAGAGVTVGAIGNSLLALLLNRDECARFRDGEIGRNDAVEELMRFDSTSASLQRTAREDLEISGTRISRGDRVLGVVGSANRDPEVFADPDRLDLTRRSSDHLAFGRGVHFCIGASLARAQVRIALERLLLRAPDLRRTRASLVWRGGLQRALSSLPVTI
jgi:cytochrome P450